MHLPAEVDGVSTMNGQCPIQTENQDVKYVVESS